MTLAPVRCCLVLLTLLCSTARADDWPQWLGPRRDGVWRERGILKTFPQAGPVVRWRVPVGAGYAGPAVAGGRVFVTDRIARPAGADRPADATDRRRLPGVERVLCLNEADGKVLWTHEYDCPYTISYASGPRATPAVDGGRVYTLGAEGDLFCLDVETGKVLWQKRLSGPDAPTPVWGFSAHPLIDGDKLITLTGAKDAVVSAFDKHTGAVLWTALSAAEPGYCPPMIFEAGGVRQLIVWHPESVNSLDPETGKVYWTHPFGPVENGVSIPTPRLLRDPEFGDLLFISDAWDGSLVLKLDDNEPKAEVFWRRAGKKHARKTDALHVLMAAPFLADGHVYGVDARGELRCLDVTNGDRLWETLEPTTGGEDPRSWCTAFIIPLAEAADDSPPTDVFIANELGDLISARLSPSGYHEWSRAHLLDPDNTDAGRPVLWCHPAFANRSVYWRNDKELICVSLAEAAKD